MLALFHALGSTAMFVTDSDVIRSAGEALYGPQWVGALAAELGISRDWARNAGRDRARIYPDHVEHMEALLQERQAQIRGALETIAGWKASRREQGS
jgi:hypothetical protein